MLTIACDVGRLFVQSAYGLEREEAALDFEPFPGSGSMPWSLRGTSLCDTETADVPPAFGVGQLGMAS